LLLFLDFAEGLPTASLKKLSLGLTHAISVQTSGATYAWGGNADGQLGIGSTVDSNLPVQVVFEGSVAEPCAGTKHSCFILDSGSVSCTGGDESSQTTVGNVMTPTAVVGIASGARLTCGSNHACVLLDSGAVSCWGKGTSGQLGISGQTSDVSSPTSVTNYAAGGAVAIAAGERHSCLVTTAGAALCSGDNNHGQVRLIMICFNRW
jgi:alpha-tubulin suppressor-like RCC1 family protein